MHLLAAGPGRIDDGETAVDLDQPPGDIVFLSAADSELAAISAAVERTGGNGPSVRVANLMRLGHPLSVDLYMEKTAAKARLVVVRMMGGAGYWPYGLDRLREVARAGGPDLAVVPGEDRWDPALAAYATLPEESCRRVWRYCVEGGAENADRLIAYLAHLLGRTAEPAEPDVLPEAGYYWPGEGATDAAGMAARIAPGAPVVPILFYRSILQANSVAPIDALAGELAVHGIAALPAYVTSLRDPAGAAFLADAFARFPPAVVLNTTAFAVSRIGSDHAASVLDAPGRPILQVVLAGSSEAAWRGSPRGLGPRDLTMNVVLPEVDGRILTRAISFKAEMEAPATMSRITAYAPVADRVAFVARQAAAWVRLGRKPAKERRVAIVLSNYPNRNGRIANGVGLDTPESAVRLAAAMADAGYDCRDFPETGAELMALLQVLTPAAHPCASGDPDLEGRNGASRARSISSPRPVLPLDETLGPRLRGDERVGEVGAASCVGNSLPLASYVEFFSSVPPVLQAALIERWGTPERDPSFIDGAFRIAVHCFGNVVVGIQPSRGYDIDPKATYHDPDLVPPHRYLAFHAWLRQAFGADAIVHLGKHGNLEWLPGKALGLSATCWPEVALGPTPLIYPFIVNDPGEGAQAKRRASAVIIDHLMPPMTRAEIHGPLAELETLIDEYYLAAGMDERRRRHLETEIVATAERHGLDRDPGISRADTDGALRSLDAHLCELKEMQIRDGLHTLGQSPLNRQRIDTLVAIARVPRAGGRAGDASLHRAIATDLGLAGFDPLDYDPGAPWTGPRPAALLPVSDAPWRSTGDTVERIEALAVTLVADSGLHRNDGGGAVGACTAAVLSWIAGELAPALDQSGGAEIISTLAALDGRFVRPGPSGAPTRGRPDVLPTGRNFYSVDVRAVPTEAAWTLGRKAADALALRYFRDEGEWPRSIAMSAWGTSNMRTGGDDIAQVLAFVGAKPVWEPGTGRVTGFAVLPLAALGRPRIDVTLKISGMFRDSFPAQIDLIDSAIRAIAELDEDATANPIAAAARAEASRLGKNGLSVMEASRAAASRIFGAKPGAYGAGLHTLIDEGAWEIRADLGDALLAWGGFVYGGGSHGEAARSLFTERLKTADAVLHNQDNREHDILDSDDYYQFQGGLAAAVEMLKGVAPRLYHGDHARPEKPVIRSLGEEIARVVRGRAANAKWIAGMMRHGYKGAFEMAATVDFLFAYAATTNAVGNHHFDILYDAYIADAHVHSFIAEANPAALVEIAGRFREAVDRGLWSPRSNSAYARLAALAGHGREAAA